MKKFQAIMAGLMLVLSACSSVESEEYMTKEPKLDIQKYFSGQIKAHGIVQDWRGKMLEQFDVEMVGKWKGDVGTLDESFTYYDGKKMHRQWTITKTAENTFVGTADDVVGKAEGKVMGNSINWSYSMYLPPETKKYLVKFDDWMWLMHDGVLINRTYLKKFGLPVGELTIIMQKQK